MYSGYNMLLVCKAVLLLVYELIIEYVFGTMLTKWILKKETHPLMNLLMGFVAYQALFQIIALFVTFTTGVLHHVSVAWSIIVLLIISCGIVLNRRTMLTQMKDVFVRCNVNKAVFICCMVVVVMFCYYVSINGESNEDARYYIGLMTTSVDTDSLFRYNVYNGYQVDSLYLRRALTTFEIHGAVLSQVTNIHPLVIARVFRACQNVILTSATVYMCSEELLWKKDSQKQKKAFLAVVFFWILQLVFADTIYTPATFLLYRAYEAKAFTANMLVLLGLLLCIKCSVEKNRRWLFFIFLFLWGCVAISTSAFMVTLVECMVLLVSAQMKEIILKQKKERLHAR